MTLGELTAGLENQPQTNGVRAERLVAGGRGFARTSQRTDDLVEALGQLGELAGGSLVDRSLQLAVANLADLTQQLADRRQDRRPQPALLTRGEEQEGEQ